MKKILLCILLLSPTHSFALDPLPYPCVVKYYKDLENIRNIREWHPFCTVMTEGPKLYRYHNGRWMDARKVKKMLSIKTILDSMVLAENSLLTFKCLKNIKKDSYNCP